MNFTKLHGAGNDYVLIEAGNRQQDWPRLAIEVCDRHYGIGADSLLVLLPSDKAEFGMRIFDADGSEAEACGNGIRCLTRYVFERGLIPARTNRISVETIAGVRNLKLSRKENQLIGIQAGMGKPEFGADNIPVSIKQGEGKVVDIKSMLSYSVIIDGIEVNLNLVSMGNPHAVYFWDRPVDEFPLPQIGPKVEKLAIFPNRTNFEVARVINRRQVELRTWERGVGETLACGSGACAVTVAAQLYGYVDSKVEVKVKGGVLQVEWDGYGEVQLEGPAKIVFTGEWPERV